MTAGSRPRRSTRSARAGGRDRAARRAFGDTAEELPRRRPPLAERLARRPGCAPAGREAPPRARDEQRKPLAAYRDEELARSHECFFGPDRSYHEARRRFVYKLGAVDVVTPLDVAARNPGLPYAKAA